MDISGLYQGSLEKLNKMLASRKLATRSLPDGYELHEFVLFGKYLLDKFGQVWWPSIENKRIPRKYYAPVATTEDFYSNTKLPRYFVWASGDYTEIIPQDGDVCPCCGKAFNIKDVIDFRCTKQGEKFYHKKCWNNYRKLKEIYDLTEQVLDRCFKPEDYTIELLPNGYCSQKCYQNIPWLLVHTIMGDIIIGKRKRVISIEWQSNFKPFDFDKLFAKEDVTKWTETDGTRGIHAWMEGQSSWNIKAITFIKKVIKDVDPSYKRYSWES